MAARNPHDRLVRWALRNPVHASAFFDAFLPDGLREVVDLRTLRIVHGTFLDPALLESITDLLFGATILGHEACISLLFEHKSWMDRWVSYTADRQVRRIWELQREHDPSHPTLPLVIPIVLHHGFGPWRGPRGIQDLLDVPGELRSALDAFLPRQPITFIDLSGTPDEALRSDALRFAVLKLAMLLLKHSRSPGFESRILEWKDLVTAVLSAPNGWLAFSRMVKYVFHVREDLSAAWLATTLGRIAGPRAEESVMTIASRLKAEGRAEGEASGEARKLREKLIRVIELRFGSPDASITDRIAAAETAQLEVWFDRAVVAGDLAAIFEAPEPHPE